MASGFLVSSTEPASARYSRFRDIAKWRRDGEHPGEDEDPDGDQDEDDRRTTAALAPAAAAAAA